MATRPWFLFLLPGAMISALVGCGGVNTFNVQNPPPPPSSTMTIAVKDAGSVAVGSTMSLTAVVSNDSSNAGVDWSLTCATPDNCGALSTLHTASCPTPPTASCTTTYTPPANFTGNNLSVNIVAYATESHAVNQLALINVTAFGSNLKAGNYVLQAQGVEGSGPNYQFAGVIALDGNGGIVSGEQTVNFFDANVGSLVSHTDTIAGGSYFLGPDGRGTITINVKNDDDIGGNGVETFTFVFLNSSQVLIAQGDLPGAATGVTASGTMDLQTSPATPSGGYAFVVAGQDVATGDPTVFGGIMTIDTSSLSFCTTPASRKSCVIDQILSPIASPGTESLNKSLSGTLTSPDSFGKVTLNLTAGFTTGNPSSITLTGYIVDRSHIKLIESDNTSGSGFGSTAGVALGQSNVPGTLTDASFSGTYVFGVLGTDLTSSSSSPATLTSAGVFTPNGSGNLTNGFTDTLLQANTAQENVCNHITGVCNSTTPGVQFSTTFAGPYSVDAKGLGRVPSTFRDFMLPKGFGRQPVFNFIFYLTGNGTTALALAYADITSTASSVYPFLGVGVAYPQSTSPTFPDADSGGNYGFGYTQQNGSEYDGTSHMTANPTAPPLCSSNTTNGSGIFSGCADFVASGLVTLGAEFNGSFPSPYSNNCLTNVSGCFTGTFSNAGSFSAFASPFAADFYVIDADHGFFVENDLSAQTAAGVPQVSLGYYIAQCPVTIPPVTCPLTPQDSTRGSVVVK